jgi:hypothetical protein
VAALDALQRMERHGHQDAAARPARAGHGRAASQWRARSTRRRA